MELNELLELRKTKLQALESLFSTVKEEKREMFTSENEKFNSINVEIKNIDKEIEEKRNVTVTTKPVIKIQEKRSEFSLLKSIRDHVEGRGISDETLEMTTRGQNIMVKAGVSSRGQIILPFEERAVINATTNTEGKYAIADVKLNMMGALRSELVALKAGATLLSGLNGTVSIPVYAGSTSLWKEEKTTATDGGGAFTEVTLSAKRLTSYIDISKMFLNQDSTGAENLLMADLSASILGKLESTIFGTASGNTTQPAGIFNGVSYTSTGATSWAKLVALESAIDTSNALTGKLAYISTPALKGTFKTTAKDSGSGIFVASEGNQVNGYPLYASSAVASGKIVYGNFADLLIGNWGAIDITVDPYTQAALGVVRLVINTYWDVERRRDASFAYGNLT